MLIAVILARISDVAYLYQFFISIDLFKYILFLNWYWTLLTIVIQQGELIWPNGSSPTHDDVIKWEHFPRNWPFLRGIHRSPVNSPHNGQWSGALIFSLICAWINGWVNNSEAGDLRHHRAYYDANVMCEYKLFKPNAFYIVLVYPAIICY